MAQCRAKLSVVAGVSQLPFLLLPQERQTLALASSALNLQIIIIQKRLSIIVADPVLLYAALRGFERP